MLSLLFSFLYLSPQILLIAAAIVPAVALLVYVYRKDRIEKEPAGLLLGLILWGVVSTFLAVLSESAGAVALAYLLPGGEAHPAYTFWMFFVIVGLSEEGFKYLVLRWRTWRSPHFDCRFDGVVYAVFVSLGFALWENIGYVTMYGLSTAMVRAITAVPGHASFGVFMGACYSTARRCENYGEHGKSVVWRWLSVLLPAAIHGAYDTIAMTESASRTLTFLIFVAVLFILAFLLVKKLSERDEFIAPDGWYE